MHRADLSADDTVSLTGATAVAETADRYYST
jgi:hypothetical protein